MIRIEFDVITDTVDEARAVLGLLADLGIEARADLDQVGSRPRPHLVAVPSTGRGAAS